MCGGARPVGGTVAVFPLARRWRNWACSHCCWGFTIQGYLVGQRPSLPTAGLRDSSQPWHHTKQVASGPRSPGPVWVPDHSRLTTNLLGQPRPSSRHSSSLPTSSLSLQPYTHSYVHTEHPWGISAVSSLGEHYFMCHLWRYIQTCS